MGGWVGGWVGRWVGWWVEDVWVGMGNLNQLYKNPFIKL